MFCCLPKLPAHVSPPTFNNTYIILKNRQVAVRVLSVAQKRRLSSMEKQKNFRSFCARKALMTLRLEQCHQNWLTMVEKYHHFDRKRPVLPGAFLFRQVVNQLADCTSFPFVLCTFGILSVNKELCFTVFLRKALQ